MKKVTDKNKHIEPTGICWGCGKDMYNGKNICSDECRDAIEIQMWGLELVETKLKMVKCLQILNVDMQ